MLKSYFQLKIVLVLGLLGAPSFAQAFTLLYSAASKVTTVGWKTNALTIDYDWSSCPGAVSSGTLNTALSTAISLWNGAPSTDLTLTQGSQVTTSYATANGKGANTGVVTNAVIFCDGNFATDFSINGSFANGASYDYWDSAGKVYTGFIGLNADTGENGNISNLSQEALNILIAHELGHLIGLGHSPETAALMYYDQGAKTQLALSQDDLDGVTYLYPRSEPGSGGVFGCSSLALVGGQGKLGPGSNGGNNSQVETGVFFLTLIGIWLVSKRRPLARAID